MGLPLTLPIPVANAIRDVVEERRRGAWWCLKRLVEGLEEACRLNMLREVDREALARALESSNPSMAAIINLAEVVRRASDVCSAVYRVGSYVAEARTRLVKNAREFVRPRIVTISFSSAVADTISSYMNRVELVWILESQPGGEGADLYRYLVSRGVNAKLVPDTMATQAVEESDIVLVGADAIDMSGCIVNKIGTRMLAILAHTLGKPVVVLAEAIKISPYRDCRDLAQAVHKRFKLGDIEVELPIFEAVEPEYIMYIVTDLGIAIPVPISIEGMYRELLRAITSSS